MFGAGGNDRMVGRAGHDIALFTFAEGPVGLDLGGEQAAGGEGFDTLVGIEGAVGSAYDDVLVGSNTDNLLDGAGGSDDVDGRSGINVCSAEAAENCLPTCEGSSTENTAPEQPATLSRSSSSAPNVTMLRRALSASADVAEPSSPPPGGSPRRRPGHYRSRAASSLRRHGRVGELPVPLLGGDDRLSAVPRLGALAVQETWPAPARAVEYYPWLDNDGQNWWTYYNGWVQLPRAFATVGATRTNGAIRAWWQDYASGNWYDMGACATQGLTIGSGVYVPRG